MTRPGRTVRLERVVAYTLGAALGGLLIAGCATDPPLPGVTGPVAQQGQSLAETQQARATPIVAGYEVSVPKIAVRSDLVELGLNPDRTVQVPPLDDVEQLGLYQPGPRPGARGPAVLLGHVNGGGRPGVFSDLEQLTRGDRVEVTTPRGPARFVVYAVERVEKDRFPTARVYSDTTGPELRLITCGGDFDAASRNYLSNIIVYARAA